MNRRDMVKSLTAGLVAAGISTDAVAIQPLEAPVNPKGTLVVFRATGRLSMLQQQNIVECWKKATRGTHWEDVRAIVLDDGLSMEVNQHQV